MNYETYHNLCEVVRRGYLVIIRPGFTIVLPAPSPKAKP